MAVLAMNTFYFCAVLGASAAIALSRANALIWSVPRSPQPLTDVVPPEPATTPCGQTLVRGNLSGEPVRAGEAAPADTRWRSIAPSLAPLDTFSRSWSTIMVAVLGGIAACTYLADGVSAGQWLLPCVGIPLIVAMVNLLGPTDR